MPRSKIETTHWAPPFPDSEWAPILDTPKKETNMDGQTIASLAMLGVVTILGLTHLIVSLFDGTGTCDRD